MSSSWGPISCEAGCPTSGPFLLLTGFHPGMLKFCSMHALHLGILYACNGASLLLGFYSGTGLPNIFPTTVLGSVKFPSTIVLRSLVFLLTQVATLWRAAFLRRGNFCSTTWCRLCTLSRILPFSAHQTFSTPFHTTYGTLAFSVPVA